MHLLLVRHSETVDNVAGVYAGVRDSALTNHGVLQASRLGHHLLSKVQISHIFSSDLQRAFKTAEAIRVAQPSPPAETIKLVELREQDFGFYEGKAFFERPRDSNKGGKEAHLEAHRNDPDFKDVESREAMSARTDVYVTEHLTTLFELADEKSVVIVSHGIILGHLWRSILRRFPSRCVSIAPDVVRDPTLALGHLGGWSNTGYLELEIRGNTVPPPFKDLPSDDVAAAEDNVAEEESSTLLESSGLHLLNKTLVVKAINSQEHLKGLKKTRGGIGSSKHDESQKTIESFFKKRKLG